MRRGALGNVAGIAVREPDVLEAIARDDAKPCGGEGRVGGYASRGPRSDGEVARRERLAHPRRDQQQPARTALVGLSAEPHTRGRAIVGGDNTLVAPGDGNARSAGTHVEVDGKYIPRH